MRASAPASSANLGPGFDCLALALDVRCSVAIEPSDEWSVSPSDVDGFVIAAAKRLHDTPLAISVESDIPVARGLGSSAALLVALAAAVGRLENGPDDREAIFDAVAAVEGHPDNAAAAVYGGLVFTGPTGTHRLAVHPSLRAVVAVPDVTLATAEARAALPSAVPFEVAVRTGSRLLRLVEALRTGDLALLGSVGADELHEPHRIALRPVIGELLEAARSAGAPFAAMSGAGPSVLALATDETVPLIGEVFQRVEGTQVLVPQIASEGLI